MNALSKNGNKQINIDPSVFKLVRRIKKTSNRDVDHLLKCILTEKLNKYNKILKNKKGRVSDIVDLTVELNSIKSSFHQMDNFYIDCVDNILKSLDKSLHKGFV